MACAIRDQGIGIPEADREWLFNAFHRGHNVDDRPGTGLGLVIVKRCIDLHGGKINVESKLGEGTVVTVRLPIWILVIDDEPEMRRNLTTILRLENFHALAEILSSPAARR
jgi:signal transduction histidine kinase